MSDTNGRISISEDRLRALFAEFELRVTEKISEKLDSKADRAALMEFAKDVGSIKREQDERRHLVADFAELKTTGEETSRRLIALEAVEEGRKFLSGWQRWFFGVVVVGWLGAIATILWLATG